MIYHVLWWVWIHTKPEYLFPAEPSWTFPEITAASAGCKVKSHMAELWDFLLQHSAAHGKTQEVRCPVPWLNVSQNNISGKKLSLVALAPLRLFPELLVLHSNRIFSGTSPNPKH